jgi:hypothetical protein
MKRLSLFIAVGFTCLLIAQPPTFSVFNLTDVPINPQVNDPNGITLGMQWHASRDGFATGIRFYKGNTNNGGVHQGLLYDSVGTLLTYCTFLGETASGWQSCTLCKQVNITGGTTYVVAYFAPQGDYAADGGVFASPVVNGPMTGTGSLFTYGSAPTFPTSTFGNTNYWIDIVVALP